MSSQSRTDWNGLIGALVGLAYIVALVCAVFLPPDNPVKGFILTLGYAAPAVWTLREAKGASGYVLFLYVGLCLTFAAMVVSQLANIIFRTNIDSLIVMAIGFLILIIGFSLKLPWTNRRQAKAQAQPKLENEQFPWTNKEQADIHAGSDQSSPNPSSGQAIPAGADTQNQE